MPATVRDGGDLDLLDAAFKITDAVATKCADMTESKKRLVSGYMRCTLDAIMRDDGAAAELAEESLEVSKLVESVFPLIVWVSVNQSLSAAADAAAPSQ